MLINAANLDLLFSGFKTVVSEAGMNAPAHSKEIVMTVPSASRDVTYAWLGMIPAMREWIGPRVIQNLKAHGFTIVNRLFESTVAVKRTQIEDDNLGVFKPAFASMGEAAKRHPEALVFGLLKDGFTSNCFDGQFFFDTGHPVIGADGTTVASVSNMQAGAVPPGFFSTPRARFGR